MVKSPPIVMTFSATDPSGGAGLQADVGTLSSLGCHPASIVTGFTVQDTIGVDRLISVDSKVVNDQARSILEDMEVSIFKLGLLSSKENISIIAQIISDYPDIPLIIDPVDKWQLFSTLTLCSTNVFELTIQFSPISA